MEAILEPEGTVMGPRDKRFLIPIFAVLLLGVGLLELSSIDPVYFGKQLVSAAVGLFALFIIYRLIPTKFFKFFAYPLYLLSLLLLIAVLFAAQTYPRRWFALGGFSLQPSEFAKLGVILVLPHVFNEKSSSSVRILKGILLTFLPFALTLMEPDLATAGTFFFIFIAVAFLSELDLKPILYLVFAPLAFISSFSPITFVVLLLVLLILVRALGYRRAFLARLGSWVLAIGLLTPIVWNRALKPYQRERVIAFLSPEEHRMGSGWQTIQARIALGSGGLFGKGYKQGSQKGLAYLPAAHTDFIFSSIGEEFGLMATLGVLVLQGFIIGIVLSESKKTRDGYSRVLGFCAASHLFYHTGANLATNLGLFPVAGIPLPFISYGGSHLIVGFVVLGLVLRAFKDDRRERRL
jgi:rod shape determining protein RodA